MKSLVIVFCAVLLIIATPTVFDTLNDARTDTTSESFQGLTSANSTTNVTLGQTLYEDAIVEVASISSNQSLDTPTAYSYNTVSRILTVTGLAEAGLTRTLVVNYNIASASLPSTMGAFFTILYWIWILIILGLCGGAIYAFAKT